MKLALNALAQTPGHASGALTQYLQMGRMLPVRDPETGYVFLTGADDAAYFAERLPDLQVVGTGWGNRNRLLRVLSEHLLVGRALARNGVDVLFQGGAGVAPFFLPRKTRLVLAVWAMHHLASGQISLPQKLYRTLFFERSLRRADVCIVNSEYSRSMLLEHFPHLGKMVIVNPHGIDADLFNADPLTGEEENSLKGRGVDGPFVLYVGQVYPYKMLHVLVEAFCRAVSGGDLRHRLVVVGSFAGKHGLGESYRASILAIMAQHGLSDRIVLLEDIGVRDLRSLYASTDLYVQPSHAETFGRTVIEAMACGAPVVAARAAATPEVLGRAGLYYDPENVAEAARHIGAVLSDEGLRRRLRVRGLARVRRFSFKREIDQFIAAFRMAGR